MFVYFLYLLHISKKYPLLVSETWEQCTPAMPTPWPSFKFGLTKPTTDSKGHWDGDECHSHTQHCICTQLYFYLYLASCDFCSVCVLHLATRMFSEVYISKTWKAYILTNSIYSNSSCIWADMDTRSPRYWKTPRWCKFSLQSRKLNFHHNAFLCSCGKNTHIKKVCFAWVTLQGRRKCKLTYEKVEM